MCGKTNPYKFVEKLFRSRMRVEPNAHIRKCTIKLAMQLFCAFKGRCICNCKFLVTEQAQNTSKKICRKLLKAMLQVFNSKVNFKPSFKVIGLY